MELFTPVDIDGVTIWYETKRIVQDSPEQPILIGVKKILFGHELKVDGARQYLEVV